MSKILSANMDGPIVPHTTQLHGLVSTNSPTHHTTSFMHNGLCSLPSMSLLLENFRCQSFCSSTSQILELCVCYDLLVVLFNRHNSFECPWMSLSLCIPPDWTTAPSLRRAVRPWGRRWASSPLAWGSSAWAITTCWTWAWVASVAVWTAHTVDWRNSGEF